MTICYFQFMDIQILICLHKSLSVKKDLNLIHTIDVNVCLSFHHNICPLFYLSNRSALAWKLWALEVVRSPHQRPPNRTVVENKAPPTTTCRPHHQNSSSHKVRSAAIKRQVKSGHGLCNINGVCERSGKDFLIGSDPRYQNIQYCSATFHINGSGQPCLCILWRDGESCPVSEAWHFCVAAHWSQYHCYN